MLIGSIIIGAVWLGWIRRQAILRTGRSICADLHKRGIQLSGEELELLFGRLMWNPSAAVEADVCPESRAVKEQHIQTLVRFLVVVRGCFWTLTTIAVVSFLWVHRF